MDFSGNFVGNFCALELNRFDWSVRTPLSALEHLFDCNNRLKEKKNIYIYVNRIDEFYVYKDI